MTVKTRFAPSPTGVLHVGGVRTALFCWLYARHHGGEFVLRIEDTDRERSTQASVDAILGGMQWLGLDHDEGPYYQTQRFDRYREVIDAWLQSGHAYYCYCTREELDERREAQRAAGLKPRYDGRCRDRTEPRDGVEPVVRFRNPLDGVVSFDDQVRGPIRIANSELDDLVIARSDGTPTYNFTVVVDDADMGITHVIRGDDHIANTPRQINLFAALGATPPSYAHVPMILGDDGARLSKRHGAVNVLDYRDAGYLPEALLNYLVRLGWSHGDQEVFTREEMVAAFDLADVNSAASAFNTEKLDWLNQHYLQAADAERIGGLLAGQLAARGLDVDAGPAPAVVFETYRDRAVTVGALADSVAYLYTDEIEIDPGALKKHLRPVALAPMQSLREALAAQTQWSAEALGATAAAVAESCGVGLGKLGQPTRVAITGSGASPGLGETLALVGQSRALARLDIAIGIMQERAAAQG